MAHEGLQTCSLFLTPELFPRQRRMIMPMIRDGFDAMECPGILRSRGSESRRLKGGTDPAAKLLESRCPCPYLS